MNHSIDELMDFARACSKEMHEEMEARSERDEVWEYPSLRDSVIASRAGDFGLADEDRAAMVVLLDMSWETGTSDGIDPLKFRWNQERSWRWSQLRASGMSEDEVFVVMQHPELDPDDAISMFYDDMLE